MEQTGIIRRIDKLGRIVVPKEFRKALNIEITDSVEIVLVNDRVEIKELQSILTTNKFTTNH